MKNNLLNLKNFISFKRIALGSLLAICFIAEPLKAQDDRIFAFSPGFGIGLGIFYPKDVNSYIEQDLSDYITTNAELYMYEEINAFLDFKFKWFEIITLAEYAIGPKIVIGGPQNYFFNRFSPGVLANVFVPLKSSERNALFIGGGVQYHKMSFEGYKGTTLGYRFQLGIDIQFPSINLQPTLAFIIANAKNSFSYENYYTNIWDMNYTGGQIGIKISFHKPVPHR